MRPRGRGAAVTSGLLGVVMLLVSACSGSSKADERKDNGGSDEPAAVEIEISPQDGATEVATLGDLEVSMAEGELTGVTVADPEGTEIAGELDEDSASWIPTEHLANDTAYTVEATGLNTAGEAVSESSGFTTLAAEATFTSSWNLSDGDTVGAGMQLSMNFNTPIQDTEAVRDAVEITTEPAVEVRGHWFGDQRLDFRPEDYWAAGTEVSVKFRIQGVEGAPGVYGTLREDLSFTVGRSQISTVDAGSQTMTVERDGEVLKTIPITAGAPGTETWNGKMVVTEIYKETRMDGATVGFGGEYDIPDVPHAMRLSTSGTFIHGNYWTPNGTFGSANVSHGCIGLPDTQGAGDSSRPGAWFYENSIVGDVVEVINSDDDIIAPDNGINGWNMDWSEWGTA